MFLTPVFLIPASIVVLFEAAILVALYYCLKGKIAISADSASFPFNQEFNHKIARIMFPLALAVSLIVDASILKVYVGHEAEERADKEMSETLKPVLAKAVGLKRDAVCTNNGYIANADTLDRDKIACAQVGEFRVLNPGIDRSSVYIFKARSETEVVQVIRNGYESIRIIDGDTTVDQLKTAFSVK
jgi:hypothetical protein